jgi:hypothetical protein
MKIQIKIGLIVGLLAPLAASAQPLLTEPGLVEMPGQVGPTQFHATVTAMAANVERLADGTHLIQGINPKVTIDYESDGFHLSVADEFYWNGTVFDSVDDGGQFTTKFTKTDVNKLFRVGEDLSIGYIGNESDDDNELYVRAVSDLTNTPALQQMLVDRNGIPALFDYDAFTNDPNSLDDPPMSYTFQREAGYAGDIFIELVHMNRTQADMATHVQEDRFRIFEETLNGQRTGNYLMAIADRDNNFDGDVDDGFFLLGGDVVPVPEPSQIAALAMAGLGGLLYVRRRIAKKQK